MKDLESEQKIMNDNMNSQFSAQPKFVADEVQRILDRKFPDDV